MFVKTGLAMLLSSCVSANYQTINAAADKMRIIPVHPDFLQDEYEQSRTFTSDEQELISTTGTYPCVFKVGNSFFDFTPFKIGTQD